MSSQTMDEIPKDMNSEELRELCGILKERNNIKHQIHLIMTEIKHVEESSIDVNAVFDNLPDDFLNGLFHSLPAKAQDPTRLQLKNGIRRCLAIYVLRVTINKKISDSHETTTKLASEVGSEVAEKLDNLKKYCD